MNPADLKQAFIDAMNDTTTGLYTVMSNIESKISGIAPAGPLPGGGGAPARGRVLGGLPAEAESPSFWADSLVSGGKKYTRLLEPLLFSPNLPHGACRIAALVRLSLGRRLWAG